MVEQADAPDSKSGGVHPPCGFDSRLRHHFSAVSVFPVFVRCNTFVTLHILTVEGIERLYGRGDALPHVVRVTLCHLRPLMAEKLLNPIQIDPVLHEPRRERMAEVMEVEVLYPGRLHGPFERPAQLAGADLKDLAR